MTFVINKFTNGKKVRNLMKQREQKLHKQTIINIKKTFHQVQMNALKRSVDWVTYNVV